MHFFLKLEEPFPIIQSERSQNNLFFSQAFKTLSVAAMLYYALFVCLFYIVAHLTYMTLHSLQY